MTQPTDTELALDRYLADGAQHVPDRVIDAALDEIARTPQRRGLPVPWRRNPMPVKLLAAAAALTGLAVIAVAALLFRTPTEAGVGQPGPSSPRATTAPGGADPTRPLVPPLGLAIVNLDGSVRQELGLPTDAWVYDLSTDGTMIAFNTWSTAVGACDTCPRDRSRTAVVDVGRTTGWYLGSDTVGAHVTWSPDGARVAFVGTDPETGYTDLFVGRVALPETGPGSVTDVVQLTHGGEYDEFPAWTPDGSAIVFSSSGSVPLDESGLSPTQEIWSVTADGGAPVQLTDDNLPDSQPDISPIDGRIVYRHDDEMWTMEQDGGNQEALGVPGDGLFAPRWSPDASKVAYLQGVPSARASFPGPDGRPTAPPLLEVLVFDVASRDVQSTGWRVASDVNAVSWTADGGALLINRYDEVP